MGDMASLTSQFPVGIPSFCLPRMELPYLLGTYVGFGDPNFGAHAV